MASSPPNPRTIHSATLSRRTALRAEGTLSISHRCFVSDHCCRSGKPVVAEKCLCANGVAQTLQLRMVASVMPGDDGGYRLAALVE